GSRWPRRPSGRSGRTASGRASRPGASGPSRSLRAARTGSGSPPRARRAAPARAGPPRRPCHRRSPGSGHLLPSSASPPADGSARPVGRLHRPPQRLVPRRPPRRTALVRLAAAAPFAVKHDVALHVRAAVMKPSRRLTLNVRLIPQLLLALGQNLDLPPGLRLLLPELGDLLALGDVLPDGVGQAQRDR